MIFANSDERFVHSLFINNNFDIIKMDRDQPLIIENDMPHNVPMESAPISQGQPYHAHNQKDHPPIHNYQGQPPQNNQAILPPLPPQNAYSQIPIQISDHPQIMVIQDSLNMCCPICGFVESYARQTAGCATFSWCVCLFLMTGFLCFWVPFCISNCYDVEVVCARCGYVKAMAEANCL